MPSSSLGSSAGHATPEMLELSDFGAFRQTMSDSFMPLQISQNRPLGFDGYFRQTTVGEVHVSEVHATPHVVERTPELIARGSRTHFKLTMMVGGNALLVQDGREALLKPHDMAIYDTDRPFSLVMEQEFEMLVMQFPKHLLDMPPGSVGELTAVPFSGSNGIGGLLAPYMELLINNSDQCQGPTGARLTRGALDLATTLLMRELGLTSKARTPRREIIERIHAYIDANLGASDLGPERIASANHISTRYLHGLFQDEGISVSSWIRSRRLERCFRELTDPLSSQRPVAVVAARWGFFDAAHFSRVFKKAYGYSPSEARTRTTA